KRNWLSQTFSMMRKLGLDPEEIPSPKDPSGVLDTWLCRVDDACADLHGQILKEQSLGKTSLKRFVKLKAGEWPCSEMFPRVAEYLVERKHVYGPPIMFQLRGSLYPV